MNRYRTSEYVGIGHPDKVADQISDTVLDFYLEADPDSRVAAETLVSGNRVIVAGEISTGRVGRLDEIELKKRIRETIKDIGYGVDTVPGNFNNLSQIDLLLKPQSTNIHAGVDKEGGDVGAGDQGIMFGYAVNETEHYLPLPYVISADLLNRLNELILTGELEGFYTDNKSQTCVRYKTHEDVAIDEKFLEKIILSCWHKESLDIIAVRKTLMARVVAPILEKYKNYITEFPEVLINSAGPFYIGGPTADAGLTGRKIIVDTYGGFAPHGGGAFSGKDPSKVDRSAAYMARHIAKTLVKNGYAYEALVQLSYAIGQTQPFSIDIKSDSEMPEEQLVKLVRDNFDLSPKGIIRYLKLNDPNSIKYKTVASGGHFLDPTATWEQVKKF